MSEVAFLTLRSFAGGCARVSQSYFGLFVAQEQYLDNNSSYFGVANVERSE